MKITCGPLHDQRTATVELPSHKLRIGVCISGGIDSAIMYYMLLQENKNLDNIHEIVPFTVLRSEGSEYFSKLVVAQLQTIFELPIVEPIIVGDSTLPDDQQVKSGVMDIYKLGFSRVYVGSIEQQPEHMLNWSPIEHKENYIFKTPLVNLNKIHIIDLVRQLKQTSLFYITHTCNKYKVGRCNNCNGCNERNWGFEQLGLTDPGMI